MVLIVGTFLLLGGFLFQRARVFSAYPSLFLFLVLACHIAISVGGGNSVPSSVSTRLPDGLVAALGHPFLDRYALCAVALFSVAAAEWIVRSGAYSRHVLEYRRYLEDDGKNSDLRLRGSLLVLVAIQLVLILILGAFAVRVNQGDFTLTSKHMAVSAIAAIAAFGRPWRACLAALLLTITEILLYAYFLDSTIAFAFSMILFVVVTIFLVGRMPSLTLIAPNAWISTVGLDKTKYLTQLLVIAITPILLWAFWAWFEWSPTKLLAVLIVLLFSVLSYVSMRCCGLATAAFPAFGASTAYVFAQTSQSSWIFTVFWLFTSFSAFTGYLYFVRNSNHHIALVTDLALILSIFEVLSHPQITGPDGARHFPNPFAVLTVSGQSQACVLLSLLLAAALGLAGWTHVSVRGRLIAHAISDPFLAQQNGLRPFRLLCVISAGCVVLAFLAQMVLCERLGSISPNIAAPQLGIASLMIGYIMASGQPLKGFAMGLLLYAIPDEILSLLNVRINGEYVKLLILLPIFYAIYSNPDNLFPRRAA